MLRCAIEMLIVLVADRICNDYIATHNKFKFRGYWGAEGEVCIFYSGMSNELIGVREAIKPFGLKEYFTTGGILLYSLIWWKTIDLRF